jgi:hypothetical protein
MSRLLKERDSAIRKFTVYYACEVGREGLFDDEESLCVYFGHVFPSIFHLAQTDIQSSFSDLNHCAHLVNAQLRFHEPDASKNPPSALRKFLSGNKRMQTVVHEMIEIFFLRKTSNMPLKTEAVSMVKTAIIAGMDIVETRKDQIVMRCIEMLRNRNEEINTKQ